MSKNTFEGCDIHAEGNIHIGDDIKDTTIPSQDHLELPPIEMAEQGIPFDEAVAMNRQHKIRQHDAPEVRSMSENSFDGSDIHARGDIHIGDDITKVTYDYASYDRAIYKKNYYANKSSDLREGISYYYQLLKVDVAMAAVSLYLIAGYILHLFYTKHTDNVFLLWAEVLGTLVSALCYIVTGLLFSWWWDGFSAFFTAHERLEMLVVGIPLLLIAAYRLRSHFGTATDMCEVDDYYEDKQQEAQNELLR